MDETTKIWAQSKTTFPQPSPPSSPLRTLESFSACGVHSLTRFCYSRMNTREKTAVHSLLIKLDGFLFALVCTLLVGVLTMLCLFNICLIYTIPAASKCINKIMLLCLYFWHWTNSVHNQINFNSVCRKLIISSPPVQLTVQSVSCFFPYRIHFIKKKPLTVPHRQITGKCFTDIICQQAKKIFNLLSWGKYRNIFSEYLSSIFFDI